MTAEIDTVGDSFGNQEEDSEDDFFGNQEDDDDNDEDRFHEEKTRSRKVYCKNT